MTRLEVSDHRGKARRQEISAEQATRGGEGCAITAGSEEPSNRAQSHVVKAKELAQVEHWIKSPWLYRLLGIGGILATVWYSGNAAHYTKRTLDESVEATRQANELAERRRNDEVERFRFDLIVQRAQLVERFRNVGGAVQSRTESAKALVLISAQLGERADLGGADLSESSFSGANLIKAEFRGCDLSRARFVDALLSDANFIDAKAPEGKFARSDLTRASFRKAMISKADFTSSNCSEASFRQAVANEVNFFEATLVKANFTGADLRRCRIQSSNLTGADLTNADMRDGLLQSSDFSGCIFNQTKLQGAVLEFARGLDSDALLAGAIWDESTQFPDELKLPSSNP